MRDGYDNVELPPPKSRLHISGLVPEVDKDVLKARFAKHGRVLELYVNTSKGFGFVQYGNPDEASRAMFAENQSLFEGRNIGVTYANKDRFGQSLKPDDAARQRREEPYGDRDAGGRFRDRDMLARDLPPRVRDRSPLHDRYEDRYLDRYDRLRDSYSRERDDVRRRDPYFEDRLPPPRDRFDDRYLPEDDYLRDPLYRDRERRDLMDRARDPLSRARDPLERGRDPLDRARDPLDRARDPLDRARDPLDRAPLDRARDPLDRAPLDRARDPLDRARDPLDRARPHLLDREDTRDSFDRRGPGSRPSDPLRDPASSSAAPPPLPPTDKPIDCEILLLEKDLRDYADFVERRLKAMSLNTGLLLISNEGSLSQALEDVTRRKVLYAIILTSQNEVHRSVTLNILHGSPQEHRNMPLEDALALVDRNFTKYLQDQAVPPKITSSSVPPPVPAPLPGEPPLPRSQPPLPPAPPQPPTGPALAVPAVELTIPQLINLLADRKQLTLGEMDRVITHMQAVRRKMAVEQGINPDTPSAAAATAAAATAATAAAAVAVATPAPVAAVTSTAVATKQVQPKPVTAVVAPKPVDSKQAELQAKILSIFNPGSSSAASTAPTVATVTAVAKASTPPQPVPKPLAFSYSGNLSTVTKPQQAAVTSLANSQSRQGGGRDINLDSPVVQKVLDKLILSGPTMLKQLATSANSISSNTSSGTQSVNKAVTNMKNPRGITVTATQQAYTQEQNEAQLRAAQQAALQTLQQHEASRKLQSAAVQPVKQTQPVQNQYQQPLVQYPQPGQYMQQQAAFQQQVASFQQQQVQYPPQQQQLPQQQLPQQQRPQQQLPQQQRPQQQLPQQQRPQQQLPQQQRPQQQLPQQQMPQQQMHPQQLNQQQQQQPQQQFHAQQATAPTQGANRKPLLGLKPNRSGSLSTSSQGSGWPRGWKPTPAPQPAYSQRGAPSTVQYPTPNQGTRSGYPHTSSQRMDPKFKNHSQPKPPGI